MKSVRELFPNASEAFRLANPATMRLPGAENAEGAVACGRKRVCGGMMNATEFAFARRLQLMQNAGEIGRFEYEGFRLKWGVDEKTGSAMWYKPDFVVFLRDEIKVIEVKGGHIWDRDIVRFKGARAYWPEFQFEMWQKRKSRWKRKF